MQSQSHSRNDLEVIPMPSSPAISNNATVTVENTENTMSNPISTTTGTASLADLSAFLRMMSVAQASPANTNAIANDAIIAPTNPEFPAFFISPSTQVDFKKKSLPSLFPLVEKKTLLDIVLHKFRPEDLHKLDFDRYMEDDRYALVLEDGKLVTKSTKGYPDLFSVLKPLTIYFDILSAFAATSGDAAAVFSVSHGMFEYMRHLLKFADAYEWDAVLQYHIHFHYYRRREMASGDYSGWGDIDRDLFHTHLFNQHKVRAKKRRNRSSAPRASQICNNFNAGNCKQSPCPQGRMHKCKACGASDHGQSSGACANSE